MPKSLSVIFIGRKFVFNSLAKTTVCSDEQLREAYQQIRNEMILVEGWLKRSSEINDHLIEIYGCYGMTAGGCTFVVEKSDQKTPSHIEVISGTEGKETLREISKYFLKLPFDYEKINEKP